MTEQINEAAVLAVWRGLFGRYTNWRATWFDEDRGYLIVQCRDTAWRTQLRLLEVQVAEKLNAALPEPVVKRVIACIEDVRVLVTGSRTWIDRQTIEDALLDAWHDAVQLVSPDVHFRVVHGGCPQGADAMAGRWALENQVREEIHPADWSGPCDPACPPDTHRKASPRHGDYCPRAGHRRNQLMVDIGADLCLAFHRGDSRGTADCISRAMKARIPVRVFTA